MEKSFAVSKDFKGDIEFDNVWFRYPTRKNEWVLKGLTMKINANETVALVGESGCGKSTIVALLLRFYDIDHGRILIDGKDIKSFNVNHLRRHMGLVMQEPTLFNYTFAENILYGQSNALNSEILEAAKAANALEFIEQAKELTEGVEESGDAMLKAVNRNNDGVRA